MHGAAGRHRNGKQQGPYRDPREAQPSDVFVKALLLEKLGRGDPVAADDFKGQPDRHHDRKGNAIASSYRGNEYGHAHRDRPRAPQDETPEKTRPILGEQERWKYPAMKNTNV